MKHDNPGGECCDESCGSACTDPTWCDDFDRAGPDPGADWDVRTGIWSISGGALSGSGIIVRDGVHAHDLLLEARVETLPMRLIALYNDDGAPYLYLDVTADSLALGAVGGIVDGEWDSVGGLAIAAGDWISLHVERFTAQEEEEGGYGVQHVDGYEACATHTPDGDPPNSTAHVHGRAVWGECVTSYDDQHYEPYEQTEWLAGLASGAAQAMAAAIGAEAEACVTCDPPGIGEFGCWWPWAYVEQDSLWNDTEYKTFRGWLELSSATATGATYSGLLWSDDDDVEFKELHLDVDYPTCADGPQSAHLFARYGTPTSGPSCSYGMFEGDALPVGELPECPAYGDPANLAFDFTGTSRDFQSTPFPCDVDVLLTSSEPPP